MGTKNQSESPVGPPVPATTRPPARLLIVDDDAAIVAHLSEALELDGYQVHCCENIESARRRMRRTAFDLLLLDLNLPDESGYDLLRQIRSQGVGETRGTRSDVAVMMVSGRSSEIDRVRAFELGCDDYVLKPFSYAELRGRITALLRRTRADELPDRMTIGTLEIDLRARAVTIEGEPVHLTYKEYALLIALASDPGRVFSREELLETVWGFRSAGSTRTLDAHACRLRAKLSTGRERYVINLWSVGYRLISKENEEEKS